MYPSLVFIGAMPPPVHGQAIINEKLFTILKNDTHLNPVLCDVSPRTLNKSFKYHIIRCLKVIKAVSVMLKMRIKHGKKCRIIYISSDGGFGLIYTAFMVGFARLLRYKIYTHYHSFSFIDKATFLMRLLIKFGGHCLTHIFLCDVMRSRYQQVYGYGKFLLLRNTVFLNITHDFKTSDTQSNSKPLVIGLLSNLSPEKGLLDFIDILKQAQAKNLPIKGILAGPAVSDDDTCCIIDAQKILGDTLEYRGAVYNQDKHQFFRDIDVFVFPTRYATEAQPNVLFEAMSYGLPIISFNRGGIASQISDIALEKNNQSWACLVPQTTNFSQAALEWLQKLLDNRDIMYDYRNASLCAYNTHLERSRQELAVFLRHIACSL